MDGEAVLQAAIGRAQETANQAFDLSKQNQQDIAQVRDRVSEIVQRTAFNEKLFLNHHETVTSLQNSVTQIQIANASISNEVKNMGLGGIRIENSITTFMGDVKKGFEGFQTQVDGLVTTRAENAGGLKMFLILGGGLFIIIQILLNVGLTHFFH